MNNSLISILCFHSSPSQVRKRPANGLKRKCLNLWNFSSVTKIWKLWFMEICGTTTFTLTAATMSCSMSGKCATLALKPMTSVSFSYQAQQHSTGKTTGTKCLDCTMTLSSQRFEIWYLHLFLGWDSPRFCLNRHFSNYKLFKKINWDSRTWWISVQARK